MGSFDISRINFDAKKHYSSVRMQQGRVLTDDDWNENERIEGEERRRSRVDIIGPYGSPDEGFKIENLSTASGFIDFDILAGTMHLGGHRLELEQNETFRLQKDWLQQPANLLPTPSFQDKLQYDLVYIETWQQPVSAVEDSSLFEVALGGPDTTTRFRTMRRVGLWSDIEGENCGTAWQKFKQKLIDAKKGRINKEFELICDSQLKVSFSDSGLPQDLCTPSAAGGYLGAENQAIRVQLVDDSHFNWGFDNASPYYKVALAVDGVTVQMISEPNDQYHWPLSNQIVEILPWSAVLSNGEKVAEMSGHLSKVNASYDPDTAKFTIATAIPAGFGANWKSRTDKGDLDNQEPADYFYMRVWNRGGDFTSPSQIPFVANSPISLGNTGLEVTFSGSEFVKDNYWIIAARPETPNKVVPWAFEIGITYHGVRRYFAPLALINWQRRQRGSVVGRIIHDCRRKFKPLTEQECCCIDVDPKPGWEQVFDYFRDNQNICICFKSGIYNLESTVQIQNKGNIKFVGGGKGSHIIVKNNESAFSFNNCKDILIQDLAISNRGVMDFQKHLKGVLNITGCEHIILENLTISCENRNEKATRANTCITVNATAYSNRKESKIRITDNINQKRKASKLKKKSTLFVKNCKLKVGDQQTGLLVIDTQKAVIEGNIIISASQMANQGIVIGGVNPQETIIRDNTIKGMLQGIHVGTSNNKIGNGKRNMLAGNTIIASNNLECILSDIETKERHGIFVGNCNSLIVRENYIKLIKLKTERQRKFPPTNGIRIFGKYGDRLLVRDNHLNGYGFERPIRRRDNEVNENETPNYGIFVHYLNNPINPKWWVIEANTTENIRIEGSGRMFRTPKMIYADGWRDLDKRRQ